MRVTTLAAVTLAVCAAVTVDFLALGEANGDPNRGKEKYATLCAGCHGTSGRGDGVAMAPHLTPKPRDFTDAKYMETLNDEHLFQVITKGGPAVGLSGLMPPYGSILNAQETQDLVAYIRSLAVAPSGPREKQYRR